MTRETRNVTNPAEPPSPGELRDALDRSADAVAVLDADRRHVFVNESFARLLGYDRPEELVGLEWEAVFPGDEIERMERRAVSTLREEGSWRGETVARTGAGDPVSLDLSLTRLEEDRLLCVARDLSEQREIQQRLEQMAYYDPLTGLANRRLLREKTQHAFALAQRGGHEVALLYLDLDSFKEINDTLGHAAGDQVLQAVARRLGETVRDADTAARVGGDEFAVLLGEVEGEKGAVQVGERILQSLDRPVDVDGHSLDVGLSIGVAIYPRYADDFDELLRQADLAMYGAGRSKEVGIRIYRPEHGVVTPRHTRVFEELRKALRHYRFEVHYQPVRGLVSGRIEGSEALVRWPHPRLGMLSAAKFLPLVEELGYLRRLDRWVLATAALQLAEWAEDGFDGWLTVHASLPTCADPDFPEYLAGVLEAADGVSPARLVLQVPTEHPQRDPESFRTLRRELDRIGVRVALSAFGREQASLEAIRSVAPDVLALDRTLVDAAERKEEWERRIHVAVDLAHTLGARVLAKGVERPEQREILRAAGCDWVEGYLEGWSVPPEQFFNGAA
jgi:diguanylate cyclase (GGDEF)-like protein/PAS domain S-box-containing protein